MRIHAYLAFKSFRSHAPNNRQKKNEYENRNQGTVPVFHLSSDKMRVSSALTRSFSVAVSTMRDPTTNVNAANARKAKN
jgi:hypothetical protein